MQKQQHLTPKSVGVLRTLLAADPEPVSKDQLNGYILPRLENNEPPLVDMVPSEMYPNGHSSKQPDYRLTDYGRQVAQAIPDDVPDDPTEPITVTLPGNSSERRIEAPKPSHPWRRYPKPKPAETEKPAPPPVAAEPASLPAPPEPCDTCPERDELALIYSIFPELADHIKPLLDLKRKLIES